MKRFLAAVVIAAPAVLSAQIQSGAPTIVTLDDALRLGEQHAPSMRTSANSQRISRLGVTRAYAAFLPSINSNATFNPAQNGNTANYSTGLSAGIQGLFSPETYFAIASAKRSLAVTEAQAVTTLYTLRTQIKQQYYSALQTQEQLTSVRNQLQVSETQHSFTVARVRNQTAISNDSIQSWSTVLSNRSNLMTAEFNAANAIRTLSRTLGIEYLVQPDPRDTANFRIVALDSVALLGMLHDSPAQVQSRANILNAKATLRTAKLRYIPQVGGSISWSRNGSGESVFGYTDKPYRYSGGEPRIGFSFSLTVFDRLGRESSLITAREGVETQEINYRDQRINQENQLYTLLNQIRLLERQLETLNLSRQLAQTNFDFVTRRYQLEAALQLDVMNAQNQLWTANNNIINARNQYRNAIAQLEQLVGRDLVPR
jgi:outer membrane protein TolC